MEMTREQSHAAVYLLIDVAKDICEAWRTEKRGVPESIIYVGLGMDMPRYEFFARLLEKAGMVRKNHEWTPSESIKEAMA